MNVKHVSFTPDATIKAAEAGYTITHTPILCHAGPCPEANGVLLVHYGMTPAYWDIAIMALRNSGNLHGQAIAEAMLNGLEEWAKAVKEAE